MNDIISAPELLAPAGSMESVIAACECGADAVYLGGKLFSARANAQNFSDEELADAVKYCHLRGVKVHRAVNTLIFDGEFSELERAAAFSAECGVDALILQDLGAAAFIREMLPDMPLHASTQMTVHTPKGAEEAVKAGFSRVVLARELPLDIIREISSLPVETEVFVHGALCMSVSGQCLMSAFIGSRSANRGQCAGACRLPFSALGNDPDRYDLSLKDLSYIKCTDELVKAGVSSFKIEGRMKRPEYTAAAVTAFAAALRGETPDLKTLESVFSRSGFTDMYLDGKTGREMFGIRRKEDVEAAAEVLKELKELYRVPKPLYKANMSLTVRKDENIRLDAVCGVLSVSVTGALPERAVKRSLAPEYARKQLSKLGGTVFYAGDIKVSCEEGLTVSAAELNSLRRKAVQECERIITEKNTPVYAVPKGVSPVPQLRTPDIKAKLRVHIRHVSQLAAALADAGSVVLPMNEGNAQLPHKDKIIIAPPPFTLDEKRDTEKLAALRECGFDKLYCSNYAHIAIGRSLQYELYGSFRLNCLNMRSAYELKKAELTEVTLSLETPRKDIPRIASVIPTGIVIYGFVPLMLARNCPIKQAAGCKGCQKMLTDRTGRHFEVICCGEYTEILNSDRLFIADRLSEFKGASSLDILFGNETPETITTEIHRCICGEPPAGRFTRGLYSRGVF